MLHLTRLQWRIALGSVLILVLVQVAALYLFAQIGRASAMNTVQDELLTGDRVFARLLAQRGEQLTTAARVLAADYGFREALLSRDRDTIASALDNHGSRIDARLMLLLGLDGQLMSSGDGRDAVAIARLDALLDAARNSGAASGFRMLDSGLHQLVVVPVMAPVPVAWVVLGFAVDGVLAEELKRLANLEVSFIVDAGRPQLLVSTLDAALLAEGGEAAARLQRAEGVLRIGGAEYVGRIHAVEDDPAGGVRAVLQIPLQRALAPWEALYRDWLGLSALGMALMVFASLWMGRTIARPVMHLADFAGRVEAGEYAAPPRLARRDEIGRLADAFAHMTDAIAAREARISELAYRDSLTGLPNRVQFADSLDQALHAARAAETPLAVLMLDIDRFRLVNDTLGHGFGDLLLAEVGQRLRVAGVRKRAVGDALQLPDNCAARLGGDEFALLVPGAEADAARQVALRIAQALEQPMNLQGQLVDVRASIGIALFPAHCDSSAEMLRCADVAMYHAKANGSGVEVYDPGHHQRNAARLSLLTELRQAVEQDELVLWYQPKLALRPGLGWHAEALVRWVHPQRGFIPPMEFIPFAEQTGYIKTITLWVMNEAIRQCAAWARAGLDMHVGLNISARDLLQPELPERFLGMLATHGCEAARITLEITESAVVEDPRHALATLERLRATGCGLSIDDYGTGYSSLSYVRQMPVHELKIDRSFVMHLVERPGDEIIVRSTIELAHDMGLTVTAEGVEDEATLQRLAALGCDLAQGYLVSKPLPAAALETWLAESRWTDPAVVAGVCARGVLGEIGSANAG